MSFPVMVITGTSRGIGRGLAEYYLDRGYRVAGCSRGPSDLVHENYHHSLLDVGDAIQVRSWIRGVRNKWQKIDALICNAGIAPATSLLTTTSDDTLRDVLRINVAGTYIVCREAAKIMMLQKAGRIITVSSMAVGLHEEGTSAYASSKSAVVEMTKILAKELASCNITCNVVAPSMIMTDAVAALGEAVIDQVLNKLTIKRQITLNEVANVISFFLAPDSGCITGQVVHMGLVT